ncbi:anti-sigma factor antagonist [Peribacillus psychrosaccharolyticus]|uniref:Anti-sigma factor antagonist n=1 Tax=Peribacillus psychrosaccharolyticus TaxID=1407 RepID=A0A974NJ07_PERPY|nr:anti-sigma factor antagonist [Peribacillus psychrosaccharolyticus]MEC2058004.1 anti-sigma factor antagonist [Peribacillus psychrosaccharolyticus]MED3745387.1 anti-sigma factor antagonist [Peribacillus psychrosaccharolyticus]QQS98618.1 anti-sigma factor antagonist [Peribacillus psychrosaccharolyticus]
MNITIDVKDINSTVEVQVKGEIDAYTAPKLRESLFPLSEQANVSMVVDLTEVSYMDSTGLGVFVGLFKSVRAHNGEFKLIGLSERLRRLFDITGLADIIDIKSHAEGGLE